ncbi:hypothetical protein CFP56_020589 [Quercus suber]|uniref:Uncharacterized protein n=1 Tax=Quercus suber TaxID=58331 RepID=A0AAW0KGD1_QUESU
MDFLASLNAGASIPQELLELVGQAIDDIGSSVWKSTAEIVTHGADKLFVVVAAGSDSDSDSNNDMVKSFCVICPPLMEKILYMLGIYNLCETDMWAPHQSHIGLIQLGI